MRKILFADDDQNVLKEFKKTLRPMCHEWEMEFAVSGEEALEFMSKTSFDVVLSDIRMTSKEGIKIPDIVMERYPETVRIILSGHSDRERVLRSVKSTHQFLIKPCDIEKIKYTIERTCKLRDLLGNETLRKIAAGIKDLPSLPTLYGMIVKEMKSPDASLKKVGYIIAQDVSMSAKILQLVNSAFYGLPRKIADPQQAAIYLGIETLKALVLSAHVFSSFTEEAESLGFSMSEMWRHSMMVSRLAKEIARVESNDKKVVEDALIAGMLHDIGKLILLKTPEIFGQVNEFMEKNGCSFVEAEYAVMKTSHAELGAYMLGLWGIPDSIVEIIAFHHNPLNLLNGIFVNLNESSNKVVDELKLNNGILKPVSIKKYLTEFTTLTAVHVANAMMLQKDCSFDTTVFPYIDMGYLRAFNLTEKLFECVDCYKKVTREEV
ncbi:MAG: HDOD domain-containing protein [Candidatus Scalinduaceae bacterium]